MFNIDVRRLTRWLLLVLGIIVILNLAEGFHKFMGGDADSVLGIALSTMDVDSENSIPTWLAVVLLAFASLLLAIIGRMKYLAHDRDRRYWAGLSVIFLYLSIDEGAAIHERTSTFFASFSAITPAFLFAWVVLFGVLLVVFAAVYVPFLARLPPETRRRFAIAGVVFVGGALIAEMVQGYVLNAFGVGIQSGLMAILEETLEFLGTILFLRALLLHLRTLAPAVTFTFGIGSELGPLVSRPKDGSRTADGTAGGAVVR